MNWVLFVVLPLLSAFIGWIFMRIALHQLFQPNRQQQLAQKAGRLASTELLSFSEIENKITSADNLKKIMPVVEVHVDEFLHTKLKEAFPMIGMFIGEKTIGQLKAVFMKELETIFPVLLKNYVQNLKQDVNIEEIVSERLSTFDFKSMLSKEIQKAGMIGALMGFTIGIIQVLIVYFIQPQ